MYIFLLDLKPSPQVDSPTCSAKPDQFLNNSTKVQLLLDPLSHQPLPGSSLFIYEEEEIVDTNSDEKYSTEDECFSSEEEMKTRRKKRKLIEKNTNYTTDSVSKNSEVRTKRKVKKTLKNETRAVREERKQKRNLGMEYTTKNGKIVKARLCKTLGNCKLKCQDRIDEEKRQTLFREYWQMKSFNKRVAFIASLIRTEPKKCTMRKIENTVKQKNRLVTHTFFLPIDGEQSKVCKKCFLKTFDESNRFITSVLKNKTASDSGVCHDDRRGLSSPANKTDESDLQLIKDHINSIPSYESHYCRKKSDKRYLPHYYTLASLYKEYISWLPQNKRPVSRFVYERVFHSIGLKIKMLKKDTCASCDKYNMLMKTSSEEKKRS